MKQMIVTIITIFWFINASLASSSVPFYLAGKLIIIEAQVNGTPGHYILDTGSAELVLNEHHFDLIYTYSSGRSYGIQGKPIQMNACRIDLAIGDENWKNVEAKIVPLSHIEAKYGISIKGLIGTHVLAQFQMDIDFSNRQITLTKVPRNDRKEALDLDMEVDVFLPFRWKSGIPTIKLKIGDELLNMAVDTGSEKNIIDNRFLRKFKDQLTISHRAKIIGISKQELMVASGMIHGLTIGHISFPELPVMLIPMEQFNWNTSGRLIDGFLGAGLIRHFRIRFDFPRQTISLSSNDGLNELLAERKDDKRDQG